MNKELIYFDKFQFPGECNQIFDFIKKYNLDDSVVFCIPDIVWMELYQHMRSNFLSRKKSFEAVLNNHKKAFGDLAQISCKFKVSTQEDYNLYLTSQETNFWSQFKGKCVKVSYPNDADLLEKLILKAFNQEKPFVKAKAESGGKTYSDAGLKDALIIETIANYCLTNNMEGILFSHDRDFNGLSEKILLFNSAEEILDHLKLKYGLDKLFVVRSNFESDQYLKESLLDMVQIDPGIVRSYDVKDVTLAESGESDSCFEVKICVDANETIYHLDITYDYNANEILDVSSSRDNE